MKVSSLRRTRRGSRSKGSLGPPGVPDPGRVPEPFRAVSGLFVGCLLIVTAVVFDSAARDSFRLPKLWIAEALGLASLVPLWLGALRRDGEAPQRWPTALLVAAPLLLAATLSALTSRHPEAVGDGLWHASVGLACLVGWSAGLGGRRLRRLLDLLLFPAALLAAIALMQAAGTFQPVELLVPLGARFELVSLAGNVGDLAMYLALPTLVALAGFLDARGVRRLSFGLLLALLGGTLLLTRTVTVVVAVMAGCLILGAQRLERRRFLRLAALLGLVLVAGLLFVPGLKERVRANARAAAAGQINQLLSGRLDGWRAAAWMMRERPLTGVGVGAFATEFSAARLAQVATADAAARRPSYGTFDTAHNDYLQLLAEQGGAGLLALLTAATVAVRSLRRRRQTFGSEGDRALRGGGLAALAIVACGNFPFQIALTAYPAVLFFAWLLADEAPGAPER